MGTLLVNGQPGGQWSSRRWGHTATAVGDRILVVGGSIDDPELSPARVGPAGWLSVTGPAQAVWTAAPQPAVERAWHSATRWRGGVVIAGGRTADASTSSVEQLASGADNWSPLPSLPANVYAGDLVTAGERLIFAGGAQGSGCGVDCAKDCAEDEDCRSVALCSRMSFCYEAAGAVWTLDNGGAEWSTVNATVGLGASATALPDGSVLVAGGFSAGVAQGAIWRIRGTQATRVATLSPRFHHTATALGDGRIVYVGGESLAPCDQPDCDRPTRLPLDTVEVFDPSRGVLTPGPQLDHARVGHTATLEAPATLEILGGSGPDGLLAPPERLRL